MPSKPSLFDSEQLNNLRRILKEKGSESGACLQTIVDAPFHDKLLTTNLDLGIVVLLLVNKKRGTIDRIALSDTELALGAVKVSAKPFHSIYIPLNDPKNIIALAIKHNRKYITEDWEKLFTPAMSGDAARLNQAAASIECSLVCPLKVKDGGALIFSFYQPKTYITMQHKKFATLYSRLVSETVGSSPEFAA